MLQVTVEEKVKRYQLNSEADELHKIDNDKKDAHKKKFAPLWNGEESRVYKKLSFIVYFVF